MAALAAAVLATPASADFTSNLGVNYDIDSPPAPSPAAQNQLDIYRPIGFSGPRPVVIYVHGGGWRIGDKGNQITRKVNLFTSAGYVFVSINYRLSPTSTPPYPADRVMFPDHPQDVGEAIAWVHRNIGVYGGDRGRITLIGHSAGAHLIALIATAPTSPAPGYLAAYMVPRSAILGVIPLDSDAFDVADRISELPPANRDTFYNAFGTEAENAATGSWRNASPQTWAGADDPPFQLITQGGAPGRLSDNQTFALRLGQPTSTVLGTPYDHEGINDAVGDPADAVETPVIMSFISSLVSASHPPKAKLKRKPAKVIRADGSRAKVTLAFSGKGKPLFECRLDKGKFKRCKSPRSYRVRPGRHSISIRALGQVLGKPVGEPGKKATVKFRVVG